MEIPEVSREIVFSSEKTTELKEKWLGMAHI